MNAAAVSIYGQVFVQRRFRFSCVYLAVALLAHTAVPPFVELPNYIPEWLRYLAVPLPTHEGSRFSISLSALVTAHLSDHSHTSGYDVVPRCGFGLRFLND